MYPAVLVVVVFMPSVFGHGYLVNPPSRNSMWREGFDTPKNYNDAEQNCGGFATQWDSYGGQCGLCGDSLGDATPRDHEAGGTYAPITRPLTRCYNTRDNTIDITVKITSHHKGYFEFRLCVNNDMTTDPSQSCIDDGYLLQVAGSAGATRYDINNDVREYYDFQLVMPAGVVCHQCILQWRYTAGNNWGCDDDGCGMGKGRQETFINCADVAIVPDCEDPTMTTGSVTDDTNSETATGPFTTQGTQPPITGGPNMLCHAIGEWANQVHMDGWCIFHCLNPALNYCPPTHCLCGNAPTARVW